MKEFEYKTVVCPNKGVLLGPERKLNKLGKEGWEAIGMAKQSNGDLVVMMKREV